MRQSAAVCVCVCRYVEGERLKSVHSVDWAGWRESEGLDSEEEEDERDVI